MLRFSVALAAVLGTPVKVVNIRARRPNPGLKKQHIAAVKAVAKLCDAEVKGLKEGSMELIFLPGELKKRKVAVNVGSAGATTLVAQAFTVAASLKGGVLEAVGGTAVPFAPTALFLKHFFNPLLKNFGIEAEMDIESHGYYPAGGGKIILNISSQEHNPAEIEPVKEEAVEIFAEATNLPGVAKRMASSAAKFLLSKGFYPRKQVEEVRGPKWKIGCSIALGIPGVAFDAIGRKGKRAEDIGREVALAFTSWPLSVLDPHTSDQILPYIVLYGGKARIYETSHVKALLWLFKAFNLQFDYSEGIFSSRGSL